MATKTFVILAPDSNGSHDVLALKLTHSNPASLDEPAVRAFCQIGIAAYEAGDGDLDREEAIKAALEDRGYTIEEVLLSFTVVEL